jgi:hypothetical protein
MKLDLNVVIAHLCYVVAQAYSPPLYRIALLLQSLYDIEHGDRAVQDAVLAHSSLEPQFKPVETICLPLSGSALALFLFDEHFLLLFYHAAISGGSLNRQPLRQKVIATVPRTHANHLAAPPQVIYILFKQYIHVCH